MTKLWQEIDFYQDQDRKQVENSVRYKQILEEDGIFKNKKVLCYLSSRSNKLKFRIPPLVGGLCCACLPWSDMQADTISLCKNT